jgi:hypothetical protein
MTPAPGDLRFIDAANLENLPWVDGAAYQWVDLDGEGVSGVLTEQAGAWFYRPGRHGRRPLTVTVSIRPTHDMAGHNLLLPVPTTMTWLRWQRSLVLSA